MSPSQELVRRRFAIGHYRWAQSKYSEEIREGFPLIQKFEAAGAQVFLEMMDALTRNNQHLLAQGLLKRGHIDAVFYLNEASLPDELTLVEEYVRRIRASLGYPNRGPSLSLATAIPKRLIRKLVAENMTGKVGTLEKGDMPGSIRASCEFRDFLIHTYYYTGGRIDALQYWHDLRNKAGERVGELLSVLASFGITGGTMWLTLDEEQMGGVLEALDAAWESFLSMIQEITKPM